MIDSGLSLLSPTLLAIKQLEQLVTRTSLTGGGSMLDLFWNACRDDEAQDIAEYAVMLAVILVLVVGTIRLVGSNANNVFHPSQVRFLN